MFMMLRLWMILLFVTLANSEFSFENITIVDTEVVCNYFQTANVSEKCVEQLDIVCGNPNLLMTIFDASSKFPYSGLGVSTRLDLGNFDQCMSVDHSYENGRILGEYCLYGLLIPDILGNLTDFESYFKLAVCRPNACSAEDYNIILHELVALTENPLGLFQDGACVTIESDTEFTPGDIAVLTIFAFIIFLMFVSTTYDVYLYNNNLKSPHVLLLSFSVLSNGRKLLHISKHSSSKEQIEVFHGLRVISMIWIVAGHGMSMWPMAPVANADTVENWTSKFSSFYMTSAQLSVDTFFFMSGFLLAFQYFKGNVRPWNKQLISVPYSIVHRYLRLTPAMLMVYLMTITFFIHLSSGPLWGVAAGYYKDICISNWWKFFLYIQNYYDFDDICLPQTWYLSADMQLFLVSPLILIPMSLCLKNFGFKKTVIGFFLLNVFFTILPLILKLSIRTYTNDYDSHSRLIDYVIGVMLGFFMRLKIDKPFLYVVKESKRWVFNLVIWTVVLLGMFTVIVCYQDQLLHHGFESWTVFESFMRPAWCVGLSWITYSCYHGYGGFVNWVLCRPIFQVVGRLTYCIYLVHITVIMYYFGTIRTRWFFTEYTNFYQFCGHYLMSLIVATFWTLAFESPLIIIEKYLLGGSKKPREDKPPEDKKLEEPVETTVPEKYVKIAL